MSGSVPDVAGRGSRTGNDGPSIFLIRAFAATFLIGLALFRPHQIRRRFERGISEAGKSRELFVREVQPLVSVDQVVLRLHQRRARIFQELGEVRGDEPSESLRDVGRRRRAGVPNLVPIFVISRRGTAFREVKDLAFQIVRQSPTYESPKIADHAIPDSMWHASTLRRVAPF